MTDSSQPIAGWYPDPENASAERWWDGAAWSDHRRPSTVAPVPPAPSAPSAPEVPAAPVAPAEGAFAAPGAPATPATAPAAPPAYGAYAAPSYPNTASNPYGAPVYQPAAPTNSLALVGFILALGGLLISFGGLTPLAGGIVSTVALIRANRMKAQGQSGHRFGMALAGVICGYAIFVIEVVLIVLAVVIAVNQPQSYDSFS